MKMLAIGLLLVTACSSDTDSSKLKELHETGSGIPLSVIGQTVSPRRTFSIAPAQYISEKHQTCAIVAFRVNDRTRQLTPQDRFKILGAAEHKVGTNEQIGTDFILQEVNGSSADYFLRCAFEIRNANGTVISASNATIRAGYLSLDVKYDAYPEYIVAANTVPTWTAPFSLRYSGSWNAEGANTFHNFSENPSVPPTTQNPSTTPTPSAPVCSGIHARCRVIGDRDTPVYTSSGCDSGEAYDRAMTQCRNAHNTSCMLQSCDDL